MTAVNRRRVAIAFGITLKQTRHEKGISQQQLAQIGGVDRTYASLLERGLRTPTITVIFRLGDALNVQPQVLVTRTLELLHPH